VQTGGDFSVDLLVRMSETIPSFRYVKDEAAIHFSGERNRGAHRQKATMLSGRGVMTMITEMEQGFVVTARS